MPLATTSKFNTKWVFFGSSKNRSANLLITNEPGPTLSLDFQNNQEAVKVFEYLLKQAREAGE